MLKRMTPRRMGVLMALVLLGSPVLILRPALPGGEPPAAHADGIATTVGVPGPSSPQVPTVATRLEALHRRAAARLQGDDDEKSVVALPGVVGRPAATHISPERAAQLAIYVKGGGHIRWIGLQSLQGVQVYAVQVDQVTVYLNAVTGQVVRLVPATP